MHPALLFYKCLVILLVKGRVLPLPKFARFVLQVGGSVLKFLLIGELVLIQVWDSIMTPGQDFIEPDTVLKCEALTNKTSGVSAVQVKLYLVRYILLSTVGRQLVQSSVR
jgi:hypothetical protein